MVTGGDTETGEVVIGDSEDARLGLERYPIRRNQPHKWHENDKIGIQPVDMLIPVLEGDRLVGNICGRDNAVRKEVSKVYTIDVLVLLTGLLEVILLSSERNEVGGPIGEGLGLDGSRRGRHGGRQCVDVGHQMSRIDQCCRR